MTGGEFFAQAHICPVCHDDHGGPDCTPRRVAECWYVEASADGESGDVCGATLAWIDGAWVCPHGHPLRRYEDLSPWVREHVEFLQTDPAMHARYFDPERGRR